MKMNDTLDIYNHLCELLRFELVYKDEKGVPHCLKSHIKSLTEDKILIAAPRLKNNAVDLKDGQEFKMIVCANDGVYSGTSRIIAKELSLTPGIWIDYPYNSQRCQRREYLRAPLDLKFELVIYKNKEKTEKDIKKLKINDLSGKGLSFYDEVPLDNYYDIECNIFMNDEEAPLKATCEHIYSIPDKTQKGNYVNALAFVHIDDENIETIIKECFKCQLEMRRKERLEQ